MEMQEVVIGGRRYRAEKRKDRWVLMEFWDDTVIDGKEYGWLFLLPDEQKEIECVAGRWTVR